MQKNRRRFVHIRHRIVKFATFSDDCIICFGCEVLRYSIVNLQVRGPNVGHRQPDVFNLKTEVLLINIRTL